MTGSPTPVPERGPVSAAEFHEEILPAARPCVFRGLVRDWPVVAAGGDIGSLSAYLMRFDKGNPIVTMHGPPSIGGRFFYNDDLSGFNFQNQTAKLSAALAYIAEHADKEAAPSLAVQSAPTRRTLPGFEEENRLPILTNVEPRVWIGTAGIVAAHHDPSENIACVVAGRRRFTLFAPDQIGNLYVGPFELTPAGARISMVSFEEPDFEKHPRFAQALEAALVADLEPGDAIYIPYHWWHHVRSLEPVNMLVNYWWDSPSKAYGSPQDALLHAILAVGTLPAAQREAWRAQFEHYVFKANGDPGEHLPEDRRGILGEIDSRILKGVRMQLARAFRAP